MKDSFPLVTAHGSAFCNRKAELACLARNIELVRPTLIMSPRRYGKTSLALRAFELSKIVYTHIDFYKELNEEDIERSILNGVGRLLGKLEATPKKLFRLASEFFSGMHVSVDMSQLHLSISLQERRKRPADTIQDALEKLHALAERKKINVAIYIDEFQRLAEITDNHAIEAAIRHVAQFSKRVIYIFSGSNRHLVEDMFFDSKRPFYKLCDTIYLERIAEEHYIDYIQKAAIHQWQKKLSQQALSTILHLTECHSYYVNLLCAKLWMLNIIPDENQVIEVWKKCAEENRSTIEREIDLLSFNQKKLLISLAKFGKTDAPTAHDFLAKVNMSSTSLSQALAILLKKDYLYRDKTGHFCVLDPLFKEVLH